MFTAKYNKIPIIQTSLMKLKAKNTKYEISTPGKEWNMTLKFCFPVTR